MATIERHDEVFVLTLGHDENRFNTDSLASINACLDEVEHADGPRALVTTGEGKFFSNGLDLDWMGAQDQGDVQAFIKAVQNLLGRVLTFPTPTVAAVNGHAFAGGAMLAIAHDRMLMREDRGFWCVNEVLLGMLFAPGMAELLKARLPQPTRHRALTAAHRFPATEAVAAGLAEAAVPIDALLDQAAELAGSLVHTAGPTLGGIKRQLYPAAVAALEAGELPD